MLTIKIETRLHERQGKAVSNFEAALPPTDSDMAAQAFKEIFEQAENFKKYGDGTAGKFSPGEYRIQWKATFV